MFVPGATGGVGAAAVQLAAVRGARTVGASAAAEELKRLRRLGFDRAVEGADPDDAPEAVETWVPRTRS